MFWILTRTTCGNLLSHCFWRNLCKSRFCFVTTITTNTAELSPKRARMGPPAKITIGTHNGVFHCDEVFACFLLKQLPEYKDAEIIRTRNQDVLETCDIVVDVGGVFDADRNRFDHHQRGFSSSMSTLKPNKPWMTKLSSAGLVYAYYGERILAHLLDRLQSDVVLQNVYDKLYENFVEEIDAIDNGIATHDGTPRYRISTNLSCRVGRLNPNWNDTDLNETEQFNKAMEMVGKEFLERIKHYDSVWWPAREIVMEALKKRMNIHESGSIILLKKSCPWKEHLYALEKELNLETGILYVIYADQTGKNWRVQCVPVENTSFDCRLPLPEAWRGLRDVELSQENQVPGSIFVHAAGFIGGHVSKEGAIEMASKALHQKNK